MPATRPVAVKRRAGVRTGDADRGQSVGYVGVDDATNTVYATSVTLGNPFVGARVYVINGNGCDATSRTGCRQTPATITAGDNPWGIAVDQASNTIYTANIANGEGPGTVSVIDGASCNGRHPSGCRHGARTVNAGFGAVDIAVDPADNKVYATDTEDTSVSVINGATLTLGAAPAARRPPHDSPSATTQPRSPPTRGQAPPTCKTAKGSRSSNSSDDSARGFGGRGSAIHRSPMRSSDARPDSR